MRANPWGEKEREDLIVVPGVGERGTEISVIDILPKIIIFPDYDCKFAICNNKDRRRFTPATL